MAASDELLRQKIESEIDALAQNERNMYPSGEQWPSAAQSTGRFLNKVGGYISSGVKDFKKSYKDGVPAKSEQEQEWEVIDPPPKRDDDSFEEQSPRSFSMSTSSHFYLPLNEDDNAHKSTDLSKITENEANVKSETGDVSVNTEIDGSSVNTETDGIVQESLRIKKNKVAPTNRCSHEDEFFKKGYLRIKQKAFPKSKYPLLYFVIDKQYGELLSQGQDQTNPRSFAKLMLSAVKHCDVNDTDRNYCFQLVTSDAEYTLQARNQNEQQEWMTAIQNGIATALGANQDRKRSNARGRSVKDFQEHKKQSEQCHDAVKRIQAIEGNSHCADCMCPRPGWAASNIGVVICIECSGIHRGLGVHISKVKSLSLDKWDISLVEFMEAHGNTKVNLMYEANLGTVKKITRESSKTDRYEYIQQKYVDRLYYAQPTIDLIDGEKLDENETTEATDGRIEINASVLCLVKDCEDCKAGRHGNQTVVPESPDFQTARLTISPDGNEATDNLPKESTL